MNEALGVMLLGRDHFHRHKNQKKSVGPDANFGHKNFVFAPRTISYVSSYTLSCIYWQFLSLNACEEKIDARDK